MRRLEKQAIVKAPTAEQLFRFWYEKYCVPQKVGHKEVLCSFELYAFPRIGSFPADKVTPPRLAAGRARLVRRRRYRAGS
ncbi:MAG: hypothetical protein QM696_01405 [Steroidobacteraceae bacterium]